MIVEFREPPSLLFDEAGGPTPSRNLVRFRLGSQDGVTFTLQAKTPGPHLDSQNVDVAVDFAAALGERREAYERLLHDAMAGSPRRFAREDVVELTWRIVQPALDTPGPCIRTSAASGAPPKPTGSSTATAGSPSRPDGRHPYSPKILGPTGWRARVRCCSSTPATARARAAQRSV